MLQHVSLELRPEDGPAAERFWTLLGFERVEPPPTLAERAAWLERAGTQIHLMWSEQPVAPPQGHAAVVVEHFPEALDALHAAGFEVEERRPHWGARRAFAAAPGGHRVELMAAPPG